MRVIILFISLCISLTILGQNKILGSWKGKAKDNSRVALNFVNSNTVIFVIAGQSQKMTYKIDYNKKPIWLDLIIKDDTNESLMKGVVEFIDNNTIKWQSMSDIRVFLPDDDWSETITLKRVAFPKKVNSN